MDVFRINVNEGTQSPGKNSTMHINGKLQTRIVAPAIKESTISPKKSSAGSVTESVYLEPGAWVKRDKKSKNKSSHFGREDGKEKLLLRAHKLRNLPQLLAEPKYTDDLDGHPTHKWDQISIIREAFTILDRHNDGYIFRRTLPSLELDYRIHALLRYTVFAAWVKKRQWGEFYKAFDKVCGLDSRKGNPDIRADKVKISVMDWVTVAHNVAFGENVSVMNIRSDDEHKQFSVSRAMEDWSMLLDSDGGAGGGWFADRIRATTVSPLRNACMRRCLSRGDSVWGRHLGGSMWLPAVIETVNQAGQSYSLRYPLTSQELQSVRIQASSKQFLQVGSNDTSSKGSFGGTIETIPVKPVKTESEVVSYVFDKVDKFSAGSVDVRVLLSSLLTPKYDQVVATSYCLSQLVNQAISQELVKIVEEKARAEKKSPSMVILKGDFINFCVAIEQLSILHDSKYH